MDNDYVGHGSCHALEGVSIRALFKHIFWPKKELKKVYIISRPDIEIFWRIEMIFQDEAEANDYVEINPGTKVHAFDVVPC